MPINPTDPRPAYQQIADDLRAQIDRGDLRPGDRLPSIRVLASLHDVAQMTIRQAITLLVNEGRVSTRQGRGAFVREPQPVRRIASSRYRTQLEYVQQAGKAPPAPGTAFTGDHQIAWHEYELEKSFSRVPAPPVVADLLEVPIGTPLLARRFVFYARSRPEQISTSYYPLSLVEGTPVADPNNEPWPGGNIAQLATLGVHVTEVQESVRARMPTPEERQILQIPRGIPVLTIRRRMLAQGRPVEAAVDIVIPADRVVLDYTIELSS
ncbi:MAG TPA: GntR family transcriptional regulator [Candidatus Dormibacteraeota bacterium]|nr:GntR family transcriptional regulator [Candidatus Dormibacteraeota bacterium]